MDGFADFTLNKTAYPDMPEITKVLHDSNRKLIPIVDAGLKYFENSKYVAMANQFNALIRSNLTGEPLIAEVYAPQTVFLDWLNNKSSEVWETGFNDFYDLFKFDAIILDMDENTIFVNGENR